jgi:hypothetical protein
MNKCLNCVAVILLVLVLGGEFCPAGNFVDIPKSKYEFSGSVNEFAPFVQNPTTMFSGDWLNQKVSIMTDGVGTYKVGYFLSQPSLFFTIDKSVGLLKVETTGGLLKTPDGDEQQDVAIATVSSGQIVLKVVKDIKLNHAGNNKATRLIKTGSWMKFILK